MYRNIHIINDIYIYIYKVNIPFEGSSDLDRILRKITCNGFRDGAIASAEDYPLEANIVKSRNTMIRKRRRFPQFSGAVELSLVVDPFAQLTVAAVLLLPGSDSGVIVLLLERD